MCVPWRHPVGSLGLNFHGAAESDFRFRRPAGTQVHPAQVLKRIDVVSIEMQERLERLGGAGAITRAIQRDREQIAGAAFCGKQLDGLAQRRNRSGVLVVFEKQHAQVHIGGGHLRIERSGALVFSLRLLRLVQRGVNVSKLEMAIGKVGLIGENLLKRRESRLKLFLVDVALRFVQQIVERIDKLFRFGLSGWR